MDEDHGAAPPSHDAPQASDWDLLPRDALAAVFRQVFSAGAAGADAWGCWPLPAAVRQWQALRLTSKHWAAVLLSTPPPLCVDVAGGNLCWTGAAAGARRWLGAVQLDALRAPLELLHSELGGVSLRSLELRCPVSGPDEAREQSHRQLSAALPRLALLEHLRLVEPPTVPPPAALPLPPALQSLDMVYTPAGGQLDLGVVPRVASIDGACAPRRLPRLRAAAARCLGVPDVLHLCARASRVRLAGGTILLGVPVPDAALVERYERPYREGLYMPPHILGDFEAVFDSHRASVQTADALLRALGAEEGLQELVFSGPGAASIKVVPVRPGGGGGLAAGVAWIHSVVRATPSSLYGFSADELAERWRALAAEGSLPLGAAALEFAPLGGGGWAIRRGGGDVAQALARLAC